MQNSQDIRSFQDVISLWPTQTAMAADISTPLERVKKWHQRNSIPPLYWEVIIQAGYKRGADLTIIQMHRLATTRKAAS